MRIVGGRLKGRSLQTPKGRATRPTSDRARETIFNIVEHAPWSPFATEDGLHGARVMDIFAGSGALGFEAMSRGAVFCLFIDNDTAARGAVRQNADVFDLMGAARIHRRSALQLGRKPAGVGGPFTLAFLDPPYHRGFLTPTLNELSAGGWLAPGALVLAEMAADEDFTSPADFTPQDDRSAGPARLVFLRYG